MFDIGTLNTLIGIQNTSRKCHKVKHTYTHTHKKKGTLWYLQWYDDYGSVNLSLLTIPRVLTTVHWAHIPSQTAAIVTLSTNQHIIGLLGRLYTWIGGWNQNLIQNGMDKMLEPKWNELTEQKYNMK